MESNFRAVYRITSMGEHFELKNNERCDSAHEIDPGPIIEFYERAEADA